jgi:D-alanyl-D-alanine carboxypeptidase (penicillin-binding protein 5/6)
MKRKKKIFLRRILMLTILLVIIVWGQESLHERTGADGLPPFSAPLTGFLEATQKPISPSPSIEIVEVISESDDKQGNTSDNLLKQGKPSYNLLFPEPDLYSSHALVLSFDSEEILLDKGSKEKIYPASLTKIMTVITAIENLEDLNKQITISQKIINELKAENSSMAGFLPGEKAAAIDLLYGAMLPSGGECCLSLAEDIAGSEAAFVRLMNEKAAELGMEQTQFMNTTGLHDPEHYTTVWDLAVLLKYSLQNDTFRQIFTARKHSTSPTNLHPDGITMYSTMFQKLPKDIPDDFKLLGGKTGYTGKAGLCLASLAKIGDREYIMVSAGAEGNHNTEQYNLTDALSVYGLIGHKQFVDKAGS